MFLSRPPSQRFPRDESRGPELRKGLSLFRVVNRSGLQVRDGIGLDSRPCGRIHPADVFCVNRSERIQHGKKTCLVRLHVVEPCAGWVSGLPKWVERFQDDDGARPGPISLRSMLTKKCAVLMKPEGVGNGSESGGAASGHDHAWQFRNQPHGSTASSPRTRWLHSRAGMWPVAVEVIPGPQYFPQLSATTMSRESVVFPKEQRFLSNTTRYISKCHEKQALGMFSPGPATYTGHNQMIPAAARSSARGSFRPARGFCDVSPRARAVTADSVEVTRRKRRNPTGTTNVSGSRYKGIAECEAAEKHVDKANSGSRGAHVMRLPVSRNGERERLDGCCLTRTGAASPGPAQYVPNVSCISPRGCPVFAEPRALDSADWERQKTAQAPHISGPGRPKTSQVHRRWPTYTHYKNGRISGNLGQDSPGRGAVNLADYDPFRPTSFLKTDVCGPPPVFSPVYA